MISFETGFYLLTLFMALFFAAGRRVRKIPKRKLSFRPVAFLKLNQYKINFQI